MRVILKKKPEIHGGKKLPRGKRVDSKRGRGPTGNAERGGRCATGKAERGGCGQGAKGTAAAPRKGKSDAGAAGEPAAAAGPGRPRGDAVRMPMFDTLAQCAAATGVPLAALKMAKGDGCEAFRHGRVDFGVFIRWFFAHDGGENTDWAKENKRLDALIKRVRLAELERKVINFAAVNQFMQGLVGQAFFGELDRMGQEYPPALKGRDEVAIQQHIAADVEKVKRELKSRLETLGKT